MFLASPILFSSSVPSLPNSAGLTNSLFLESSRATKRFCLKKKKKKERKMHAVGPRKRAGVEEDQRVFATLQLIQEEKAGGQDHSHKLQGAPRHHTLCD